MIGEAFRAAGPDNIMSKCLWVSWMHGLEAEKALCPLRSAGLARFSISRFGKGT